MRGLALSLALGLAACAPQNPAQTAERDFETCVQVGFPAQRLRACSAVIANADAPAAQRVEALINRGALRAAQSQHVRAIADFGRALRLEPNSVQALLERGIAHQDRGAYEAAVGDFDAALRLQPGLQLAARRREEALAGLAGVFRTELERLNREIASAPGDAMLLNNRCWVRAINGQELEQALADCDESLRIEPDSAAVHDSRGLVNYKLRRFEAALADYDAALAIDPGVAHYAYGRGAALIALGQEAEGREALQQAASADDRVADLYRSYGVSP